MALQDGTIASGGNDHVINLSQDLCTKDSETAPCVTILKGHEMAVLCMVQLHSGELVSGSEDKTIKFWNVQDGSCMYNIHGHERSILAINQIRSGEIVTGCDSLDSCMLRVWGPSGLCQEVRACDLRGTDSYDAVNAIEVLEDGRMLFGTKDSNLHLYSTDSSNFMQSIDDYQAMMSDPELNFKPMKWLEFCCTRPLGSDAVAYHRGPMACSQVGVDETEDADSASSSLYEHRKNMITYQVHQ